MLVKLIEQGGLVLPKTVLEELGYPSQFRIEVADGRLILTPEEPQSPEQIRAHIASMGVTREDIHDAIQWARSKVMP